jgi:hypothetical protein
MKTLTDSLHRASGASLWVAGGIGLLAAAGLPSGARAASPLLAEISLNIVVDAPPPPPRQEIIVGVSPGPGYAWIGGYWDGSPGHYTWVGGRWDRSPSGHGQWSAPHWDKDRDGHYHQTKGEWRDSPRH